MPTFDVVSEVDMQEVKNAIDQASREVATRFDFKNTDSTIELSGSEIHLHSNTEDRLKAVVQVLEEKMVRREVSLNGRPLKIHGLRAWASIFVSLELTSCHSS